MKTTSHSEFLKLKTVYIKPAENAFISNEILKYQWGELNYLSQPDFDAAKKEYNNFEDCLISSGVEIYHFPRVKSVTIDSIYCRDATIATDFGMIVCNMGKNERKNEPFSQLRAFKNNKIPVLGSIESPGTLEGGDVAWIDDKTLAVGHTYRTNDEGISQLKNLLEPNGVGIIIVDLPHYRGPSDVFHLMSIFSPVDKNLAVIYSPLMPIKFRNELIKRGFDFIEVADDEFESMACNVLALAPRKCLMLEGNPKTHKKLLASGCEVISYKGEEISLKGGGGPTCLTRPLLRTF
jgi:N-dimethylarginine dimethylaminohydrolase